MGIVYSFAHVLKKLPNYILHILLFECYGLQKLEVHSKKFDQRRKNPGSAPDDEEVHGAKGNVGFDNEYDHDADAILVVDHSSTSCGKHLLQLLE